MPEPHTIDCVTAHDPYSKVSVLWRYSAPPASSYVRGKTRVHSQTDFRIMTLHCNPLIQCHSGGGNEMVTTLFTGHRKTFICKQLDKLPPVVGEWQQSCKQQRCSHYCAGACCNPGRQSTSARCPFDGMELLLVDAEPIYSDDATPEASPLEPWLATLAVPKKG